MAELGLVAVLLGSLLLVGATSSLPATTLGEYDPWCDLDDDGDIDIFDVVKIACVYGSEGTPIDKAELVSQIQLEARWTNITKTGRIIIGTDPSWPTYEFINNTGHLVGFEVELMEMIAVELNLTVTWIQMAFDTVIPAVQSMEIDLGVSGFSVTSQRLEAMQFTMYHSITERQVVMLQSMAEALGITELDFLSNLTDYGLKCGAALGSTAEYELLNEAPDALVTYADLQLALEAMKLGVINCVYEETPITSSWIFYAEQQAEEPIVVIYGRPYFPVAFVAHRDADTLVAKVDGALADIIATGRLDVLRQKWHC